jgi:hypothetical protein
MSHASRRSATAPKAASRVDYGTGKVLAVSSSSIGLTCLLLDHMDSAVAGLARYVADRCPMNKFRLRNPTVMNNKP